MEATNTAGDGIVPIVNTPFNAEGDIDYRSLERAVDRAVTDGVAGLIAPAVASEVSKLSLKERLDFVSCIRATANGRVPVIAGCGVAEGEEGLALLQGYQQLGCDYVLVQLPESLFSDPAGAIAYFDNLRLAPFKGVMVQDLAWAGDGAHLDVLLALRESLPNFSHLKIEVPMAGAKFTEVREAVGPDLVLASGWALPQMIEALDRGVNVFNSTAINYPFVVAHRRYAAGDRSGAIDAFESTLPVLAWSHQHIEISIAFLKRYCKRVGLFSTDMVRPPAARFDAFHARISDELIDNFIRVEERLRAEEDSTHRLRQS